MCARVKTSRQIYYDDVARDIFFLTSRSWWNSCVNIVRFTVRRDDETSGFSPRAFRAEPLARRVNSRRNMHTRCIVLDGRPASCDDPVTFRRFKYVEQSSVPPERYSRLSRIEIYQHDINCYINTCRAEFSLARWLQELEDDSVGRKFVQIVFLRINVLSAT